LLEGGRCGAAGLSHTRTARSIYDRRSKLSSQGQRNSGSWSRPASHAEVGGFFFWWFDRDARAGTFHCPQIDVSTVLSCTALLWQEMPRSGIARETSSARSASGRWTAPGRSAPVQTALMSFRARSCLAAGLGLARPSSSRLADRGSGAASQGSRPPTVGVAPPMSSWRTRPLPGVSAAVVCRASVLCPTQRTR